MTGVSGTSEFYEHWAATGQESPRSAISRQFESAFPAGARVLDVGCGMGRDLAVLREMGIDAWGVEPHAAMRTQALARHPDLAGRIEAASLPGLGQPFGGGFDGVLCSAVLMHVPPDALPAALAALVAVLRPRARLLMALPEMRPELLQAGRDPDGRAFANHAPAEVDRLLAAHGFALLRGEELATPSVDTVWRILLFDR